MSEDSTDSEGGELSRFREIQLHPDAIGIVEKELGVAGARHNALAEFHVVGLQTLAHALDVACRKSDVVESAGVVVLFLGATYHDALARLARAHQVNGGDAAGIEPIAGEVEWRAVA